MGVKRYNKELHETFTVDVSNADIFERAYRLFQQDG